MKTLKTKFPKMSDIYKPMPGTILIQSIIPTMTDGGIIIPEDQRQVDSFATIVAIGKNVSEIHDLEVGDEVLLKAEAHEMVPAKRVVILTEMRGDKEYFYVQITAGTVMGVISGNFKELAKKSYESEFKKEEKRRKAHKSSNILVPDNKILKL